MHGPRPAASAGSPIQAYLDGLHARFADVDAGELASYIPELRKVDPGGFGIAIATVDGHVYEAGDARRRFTLQSISKPLVYGVALEDRGMERVLQSIAVEPSGEAFNSISLEPGSGRPLNPMINAGAIAAASLVAGADAEARRARVLDALSAYAGRPLDIDVAVYESERESGHRNRAIGHLLRSHGILDREPEEALDLYFRQCSVRVDCRDLALIAATLANGGLNPLTRRRAVRAEFVSPILSVMATCGMYDFAGTWAYRVGLPAKSGVGGGIVAVLPGQLGIGVYSPRLDARGNSVRGVRVCERLSAELGLHFLQPPRPAASTVRALYTLAGVRSKRRRTSAESRLLDAHGEAAIVFELQGDLGFATLEPVLREIDTAGPALRYVVLDYMRVGHADAAAARMLAGLAQACAQCDRQLVLARVRRGELLARFEDAVDPHDARTLSFQPQLDGALEWCERRLLSEHGAGTAEAVPGGLVAHRLCEGVGAEDLAQLEALLARQEHEAGALIVRRGDPADALHLLMRGEVSVLVELPRGGQRRLSTLSAGMSFGEAALQPGGRRSADVRADTAVECRVLAASDFARLEREQPALALRLLHNLLRGTAETAVRLTADVAALEG